MASPVDVGNLPNHVNIMSVCFTSYEQISVHHRLEFPTINYGKEVKRKLDLNFWTFKE
jgi:hypothetical protein